MLVAEHSVFGRTGTSLVVEGGLATASVVLLVGSVVLAGDSAIAKLGMLLATRARVILGFMFAAAPTCCSPGRTISTDQDQLLFWSVLYSQEAGEAEMQVSRDSS